MLAQCFQSEGIVSFGEADAVSVEEEWGVEKSRSRPAKRAKQEELAKGTHYKIGAADDLGDAKFRVIDDCRELIAWRVVFSPNEKITEIAAGHCVLRAEIFVGENDGFVVGYPKSPIHGDGDLEWR